MRSPLLAHFDGRGRVSLDTLSDGYNQAVLGPGEWFVWDFHPSIAIGICVMIGLYVWIVGPARRRYNWGPKATRFEWVVFLLCMVLMELSLDGPVHHLADNYLFSVHMFQHLVITLFVPLMLVAGVPPWAWDRLADVPVIGSVFVFLIHPIRAFLFYNGVLLVWHLPGAYDLAMFDHDYHVLEHVLFMGSAVFAWWPLLSRSKRFPAISWGWQLIYLFAMSLPMKALGAVLTFKADSMYQFYAAAPRVWGLTPAGDQRLGGLLMWLPAGLVLWGLAARAFFRWFYEERGPRPRPSTPGVAVLALIFALTGCQQSTGSTAPTAAPKPAEPQPNPETESAGYVSPWRFSSSGKHKVRFLLPKKVPLNELIEPIVEVTDLQGNPVKSTLIKADATMPEHGHGMMTQSRPKNCAAESECQSPTGRYTFEGFRLHMPGNWLFQVELGKDDQATWRYEFEPDF